MLWHLDRFYIIRSQILTTLHSINTYKSTGQSSRKLLVVEVNCHLYNCAVVKVQSHETLNSNHRSRRNTNIHITFSVFKFTKPNESSDK